MKKARALKDFSKKPDAALLQLAHAVAAGSKNNPDFPNAGPLVEKMEAADQVFENAMAAAKSKDQVKIAERKAARRELEARMEEVRAYVNYIADGDRRKLLGTGFTISAEFKIAGGLGEVKNFKAILGRNSGEVILSVARVDNAKLYHFYFAESPVQGDNWKNKSDNLIKKKITGLQRGKEYDFRVGAIGKNGDEVFSAIVTLLVV